MGRMGINGTLMVENAGTCDETLTGSLAFTLSAQIKWAAPYPNDSSAVTGDGLGCKCHWGLRTT